MRHFLILMALLCSFFLVTAQETQKKSITEILSLYENQLNIKFSFDPELIQYVNSRFDYKNDLEDFISTVEDTLPIRFQKIGDQYYTISSVVTGYSLTVSDSLSDKKIAPLELIILVNGEPVTLEYNENSITFNHKPDFRNTVMVYSIGYNKKVIGFSDLINKRQLSLKISSPLLKLSEVIIQDYLTKGINLNPSNQSINIAVRDLPLLPGETDGDIFASITALPGITNPDGRAGNLFVRGSDTDQTMILFDNIPVYHKGHYYGTISPYNPKVVDNVEVYRNGFHPRLGGRVGGAIIINSDQNIQSEAKTGFGLNSLFGMAYTKIPITSKKLGISIGARRSFPSAFQSPKLTAISESVFDGTGLVNQNGDLTGDIDVLFEDYHGRVTFQLNDQNNLSLSGIYTNTDVNSSIETGMPGASDNALFRNSGLNFDWKSEFNQNWQSSFSATASQYRYEYITKTAAQVPIYSAINELTDINLRQEFSHRNENTFWCQMGIDYKWQEVFVDFEGTPPNDPINIPGSSLNNTTSAHSVSPFANWEYYGLKKWYFQLGIRGTYFSQLDNFKIAPRVLVNYELTNWMTLKASTGWYNQYLSQVKNLEFGGGGFDNELWTLADNEQGHIIDGTQSMLGTTINKGSWILDIEAFRKKAKNITVYEERRFVENRGYFTMDQLNYGIDFLLKRQINNDASIWSGYSYNRSKITIDTTNQTTYEAKYVQPNVWYLGGAYQKNRWKMSAAWKYASGLNAQSLDLIHAELLRLRMLANNPPPQGAPSPPNPFENRPLRYDNIHSLDLSVSYKIPKNDQHKWSASFGVSLINVFNQEIVVDQVFRGMDGFVERQALKFAPNIMAIIEW